jgi:hypothetical protein
MVVGVVGVVVAGTVGVVGVVVAGVDAAFKLQIEPERV